MTRAWALYVVLAIVLLVIVFQLFLRYDYRVNGGALVRIDRLTQTACLVRLGSRVAPSPLATDSHGAIDWGSVAGDPRFCP